ncbi:hypothetical protein B0H13DRAFT_2364748 [Mycena leptocephala]|nr:hypothetical protein B0H13DRAFT_2364748 [Mycena leptocephala]
MQISSSTVSDDRVLSDLWTSHNKHGKNSFLGASSSCRGKLTSVVDTLALSAVALAPSAKRTWDEDVDNATCNTRPCTEIPKTVALPTRRRRSVLPHRRHDASARDNYTSCSTSCSTTPTVCSGSGHASAPGPLAPPGVPAAPPRAHAIPQRQAAPQVDSALQVVFGPITWNRDSQNRTNVRQDIINLLTIVFPTAAHLKIPSTVKRSSTLITPSHPPLPRLLIGSSTPGTTVRLTTPTAVFTTATHIYVPNKRTLELPHGYSILSRTQRPRPSFDKSWGGVAAFFQSALKLKYRQDFMVFS